jgi:hypothetical protein
MVYLLGVLSTVSIVLNVLIYKRITASLSIGSVEEFDLVTAEFVPGHCCCCKADEQPEIESVEAPQPVVPQDVYGAWKNEKDIPWVPPIKTPEPLIQTPNRAPLARPDGFV